MDSFHRADWLSLAQAVSSTLAVVAAFGVVFLQRHFDRQREKKDSISLMDWACTEVEHAYQLVALVEKKLQESGEKPVIDRRRTVILLNQTLGALNAVPTVNLPSVIAIGLFRMAADQIERLAGLMHDEKPEWPLRVHFELPSMAAELKETKDRLLTERNRVQ